MLRLCLCVTGTTGSGKSTLVRNLGMKGWTTLHLGDIYRKMGGTLQEGESSVTPESFDNVAYGAIMQTLLSSGDGLVAMEAFPRGKHQLPWVLKMVDKGWTPMVLMLDAHLTVRKHRVLCRDICDKKRVDLDERKLLEEQDVLSHMVNILRIKHPEIMYIERDTSLWDYSHPDLKKVEPDKIEIMATSAFNYWTQKTGYGIQDLSSKKMISRMMDELAEYRTSWNPDELIDVLWFLLLAFKAYGISNKEIYEKFMYKCNLNHERMEKGVKPYEGEIVK